MIYDTIDHAVLYRPISANLAKALDFLTSTDLSKYDTERVEIDGDKVYALFQLVTSTQENLQILENIELVSLTFSN